MNQTTCTLLTPKDYATSTILNEVCVKCIIFLNDLRLSFFSPFYYFAYLIEDHFRCNIGTAVGHYCEFIRMGYDNPNHMLNIVNKGAEWVGLKKTPRSLGGVLCIVLTAHLIFYNSLSILTHF